MTITRYLPAIRFFIRGTLVAEGCAANVEAFGVVGALYPDGTKEYVAPDDESLPLLFGSHGNEGTEDISKVKPFLGGGIKWDNCANLIFEEDAGHYLHFCDRQQAVNVGILMGELYDLARELIGERWDGQ